VQINYISNDGKEESQLYATIMV